MMERLTRNFSLWTEEARDALRIYARKFFAIKDTSKAIVAGDSSNFAELMSTMKWAPAGGHEILKWEAMADLAVLPKEVLIGNDPVIMCLK